MAGGGRFAVVNRTLVAQSGNGIGLLYYTAEQFDDFTLRLDFYLPHPRGNSNDNSGVFVRFRDPRSPGARTRCCSTGNWQPGSSPIPPTR